MKRVITTYICDKCKADFQESYSLYRFKLEFEENSGIIPRTIEQEFCYPCLSKVIDLTQKSE